MPDLKGLLVAGENIFMPILSKKKSFEQFDP